MLPKSKSQLVFELKDSQFGLWLTPTRCRLLNPLEVTNSLATFNANIAIFMLLQKDLLIE